MDSLKIGVIIDSLRLGVRKGIEKAAQMGVEGFQIYVTTAEMAPWNLSHSARRDFLNFASSQGLEISAFCADLHEGLTTQEGLAERIDKSKQMLTMASDMKVPVVTTHIGTVTEDKGAPEKQVLDEVVKELGDYADKVGVKFGIETGPEDSTVLKGFLDRLGSGGLAVNYDPANFVTRGFDHLKGVYELKDYIVHTHAKDGIRMADGTRKEVPLGEGMVQWPEYLGRLEEIGYQGYVTIEREVGEDPVGDVVKGIEFLHRFIH